jgi:tRNA modification GTPase
MDFSDQDADVPIPADAPRDLEVAATELHGLASASRGVAVRRSAFRVVLTGPPNAGKSSLFNRLLGEEAALVSPVPGTTRDVLCGEIVSGGVHVELVDTAGVGVTREAADRMAHGQRRRSLREADLVLQVRDVRDAASVNQRRRPVHVLRVLTHVDLLNGAGPPPEALCVSNLTGSGVDSVWDAVLARLATLDGENESVCVSARQGAAFRQAAASLFHAAGALSRGVDAELVASDLRASLHHIGEVTGERVSDAVLDRVFSEFCIGK